MKYFWGRGKSKGNSLYYLLKTALIFLTLNFGRSTVPKGYWIVHVDITNQEKFKEYLAENGEPLKRYGARFLARAGKFQNPEGISRSRNTIIEFPSYEAAIECWNSKEYQHAASHRISAAIMDLTIVEGYEGPQPL